MRGDLRVTLDGSEVDYVAGTLVVTDRHGGRSTAVLRCDLAAVATRGCPVLIEFDEDPPGGGYATLFAGYVAEPRTIDVDAVSGRVVQELACVDQHYLADKRQVVDGWTSATTATIVGDIITNVLAAEGVTAGTIETGPTFDVVAFNYGTTCARALDLIAQRSGMLWRIDSSKALHMRAPSGNPAPFDLDLTLGFSEFPEVAENAAVTRNRQIIKGGQDLTSSLTETEKGDGEKRSFVVEWPIGKVPTVEVDTGGGFTAQTVGIRGVDTGEQWYWSKGDNVVSQDAAETVLGATDRVRVTYQGLFPLLVQIDDEADQSLRAAKEGGTSGIVTHVVTAPDLESRNDALAAASQLLETFAKDSKVITAAGDLEGAEPGQSITVDLPPWGITADPSGVVSQVETFDDGSGAELLTRLVVTIGPESDPVKAWAHALEGADLLTIRENISPTETLQVLHTVTEGVGIDETVSVTVNACTTIDNPGALIGSFTVC